MLHLTNLPVVAPDFVMADRLVPRVSRLPGEACNTLPLAAIFGDGQLAGRAERLDGSLEVVRLASLYLCSFVLNRFTVGLT